MCGENAWRRVSFTVHFRDNTVNVRSLRLVFPSRRAVPMSYTAMNPITFVSWNLIMILELQHTIRASNSEHVAVSPVEAPRRRILKLHPQQRF